MRIIIPYIKPGNLLSYFFSIAGFLFDLCLFKSQMPTISAGILFYRFQNGSWQVLLIHPGGPFWSKKDEGVWSIPKGEVNKDEDLFAAAKREVFEELGVKAIAKPVQLNGLKQKSGKVIYCWAMQQDINTTKITSNMFELEWPPRSGRRVEFPEVDRAEWFDLAKAKTKILPGQLKFVEQLETLI
jgi:predicted NUDIX family NTP pyrophosphohydrolase